MCLFIQIRCQQCLRLMFRTCVRVILYLKHFFQSKENMWTLWYGAITLTLPCWRCRGVAIWPFPHPTMPLVFAMMQPSPSYTARTWSTGPSKAMPFLGGHGLRGPTWTCGHLSFTLSTESSPSTFPEEWRQRGNWQSEWPLQKTLATFFQASRISATPCYRWLPSLPKVTLFQHSEGVIDPHFYWSNDSNFLLWKTDNNADGGESAIYIRELQVISPTPWLLAKSVIFRRTVWPSKRIQKPQWSWRLTCLR